LQVHSAPVPSSRIGIARRGLFGPTREVARAASFPAQFSGIGIVAFELLRDVEKGAVQHCAIVAGALDEPRLGDESAEFDQMFGARAPAHDPRPIIRACSGPLKTVPLLRQPPLPQPCRPDRGPTVAARAREKIRRPSCSIPR
jgi:hypothetical protein